MLILTFDEFNNRFGIDDKAMSNIRMEDIGKDISIIPIEIVMRDQTPLTINDDDFNIIVNLHPTDGTHWVLVIRRGGKVYYFDSFGVDFESDLDFDSYFDLEFNSDLDFDFDSDIDLVLI